jgi:histidine phosphotransferase ChpT
MSDIDVGMLEILASKICHDLISPIGAVNNGIEFLEDMGKDAGPEVTELISFSAGQASAKLKAFRLAYGVGGGDSNLKAEEAHTAIQQIVGAETKIAQTWNPNAPLGDVASKKGFVKVLTCVLLLAMEALPKGGKLIALATPEGNTLVRAEGADAGLRGDSEEALKLGMTPDKLEPKYVHPYMTGLIAKYHGFKITVAGKGDGFIDFQIAAG